MLRFCLHPRCCANRYLCTMQLGCHWLGRGYVCKWREGRLMQWPFPMGMLRVFFWRISVQFLETVVAPAKWWLELLSFWGLASFQKTIRNVYIHVTYRILVTYSLRYFSQGVETYMFFWYSSAPEVWGSGLLFCDSVAMPAALFRWSFRLGSSISWSCCDWHGAATLRAVVVGTATLVSSMAIFQDQTRCFQFGVGEF